MLANRHGGLSEYLKLLGYRRFHYLWWPKSAAPLAVLLHGLSECADTFGPFARSLRRSAEVIAIDLRGHGGAPWDPGGQYGFEDYLDDLRIQLEYWQRPAALVGTGYGALIAREMARRWPDKVTGVAVMGPLPSPGAKTMVEVVSAGGTLDRDWENAALTPNALLEMLTWARPGGARAPKCDPEAIASSTFPGAVAEAPPDTPAIIVGSDESRQDEWPGAQLAAIRQAGRWPHVGNAAGAADVVGAFIEGL